MKFAVHLGTVNAKFWAEIAEEADRLGYESVWIPDHIVVPHDAAGSPYAGDDHSPIPPDIPIFDPFAVLGHLAARTERIRLGINVYNVGLRHPFITARGATTVDVLSNGRLELGVGSSWLRSEWDALGLDFERRGRRVDETLEVCRRLWSEETVEHHGEFFDFGPVTFAPRPVQSGGPPLQIGGDGPAALRRAATVGRGWMPMNHKLEELGAARRRLEELGSAAGRTTPIEITTHGQLDGVGDVARYASAGATRLIVQPWSRSTEAKAGLRAFADEYLR